MKRLLISLFALALGLSAQTPLGDTSAISGALLDFSGSKITLTRSTAAPDSGDCNAAGEVGRVHLRSDNPATNPTVAYRCIQTGASSYAWDLMNLTTGTTAPATCVVGQLFFDTDATAGSNLFGCTASNTWTALGGGGSGGGAYGFQCCQGASTVTANSTFWGMGQWLASNATQILRATAYVPLDTAESCTVSNLRVRTVGGSTAAITLSGGTLQVDVAINGTASAVTCTVADGASTCSDVTNSATANAGDYLSFKFTSGGYSSAPYIVTSFDCRR